MKLRHMHRAWLTLGVVALLPRTAIAQEGVSPEGVVEGESVSASADGSTADEGDGREWTYPKSYSVRRLTMQKGMIRANAFLTVWDDGVDTNVGMTLGASISVTDDLELGINNYRIGSSQQQDYEGLIPVVFAPSAGFGNMPLYGRYRFVKREKLDFAGDLIFVLPTDTAFALEGAFPFRIKPNERLSVDTGVEVRGTFGSSKRADIRVPAIVNYNFSSRAFISGETGVWLVNLGKNFDTATADSEGIDIPVGFRAGGTWKKEDKHLIDLFAGFAFPALIEAGTSRKTIDFGIWDIFVGVAFYTRPLFLASGYLWSLARNAQRQGTALQLCDEVVRRPWNPKGPSFELPLEEPDEQTPSRHGRLQDDEIGLLRRGGALVQAPHFFQRVPHVESLEDTTRRRSIYTDDGDYLDARRHIVADLIGRLPSQLSVDSSGIPEQYRHQDTAKLVAELPFRTIEQKQPPLEDAAPSMPFGTGKLNDADALIQEWLDDLWNCTGSARATQIARIFVEQAMRKKNHMTTAFVADSIRPCPCVPARHRPQPVLQLVTEASGSSSRSITSGSTEVILATVPQTANSPRGRRGARGCGGLPRTRAPWLRRPSLDAHGEKLWQLARFPASILWCSRNYLRTAHTCAAGYIFQNVWRGWRDGAVFRSEQQAWFASPCSASRATRGKITIGSPYGSPIVWYGRPHRREWVFRCDRA